MKFTASQGFALPSVIISAVVMISVLLVGLSSVVSVGVSLENQLALKFVHEANQSGIAKAQACLAANDNKALWNPDASPARPLTPATDCSGNQLSGLAACTNASTDARCFVTNQGKYRSSFSVTYLEDADGRVKSLSANGVANSVRATNSNSVYQSTTESSKVNVVSAGAAAPAGVTEITVSTLTGASGSPGVNNSTLALSTIRAPRDFVEDSNGNFFFSDRGNHRIRKIDMTAGTVSDFAGSTSGYLDGQGTGARFNQPSGLSIDSNNNIYVADYGNERVRKISSTGAVTTIAGTGSQCSCDGPIASARLQLPTDTAVALNGDIFVTEEYGKIRRIVKSGSSYSSISTFTSQASGKPYTMAVDNSGNVYTPSYEDRKIYKFDPSGNRTTFAGSGNPGSVDNSDKMQAQFDKLFGIAIDPAGNVYVTQQDGHNIRKISSAGRVTTLAGTYNSNGSTNGTQSASRFFNPQGIIVKSDGDVYVADKDNHLIRRIQQPAATTPPVVSTIGSSGSYNNPNDTTVDSSGNVYVADTNNHQIKKITPAGVVTTFAGSSSGYANGTGASARFNTPTGLGSDPAGNIYVADKNNYLIRKITPAGVVSTIAGLPSNSGTENGSVSTARLKEPYDIAVASDGSIYITDMNSGIRKLNSSYTTLSSFATMQGNMFGIAVDSSDNVYGPSFYGQRIYKYAAGSGNSSVYAGDGGYDPKDAANPLNASFRRPYNVAVDSSNAVYVTDKDGCSIRKIESSGTSTLAGVMGNNPNCSYVDGIDADARVNNPLGISVGSDKSLYVADTGNNRIRKIVQPAPPTPSTGETSFRRY
jgi:sugar lactone lactonase YvrE